MLGNRRIPWLGLGFVGFGVLLLTVIIPVGVTSPSNIQTIVLAPTFWPVIIAWLIIGLGGLHAVTQVLSPATEPEEDDAGPGGVGAWARMAAVVAVMIVLVWIANWLGLVWTAMLAFAALSVIVRSPMPVVSAIVTIVLPLALYVFFAHVAGVAVPQGELVRLP